jgi:DNA mismatch repair protein MutS
MSKYTPMIEQYLAIKREAGDAILMFRLGDFYEMFFEDAILAARELEITLTGRDGGAEERIPMCGVPYHSADAYISRLVDKGYKVAICEQMEDPAAAKGVVRREIVRIVTPGTVMDGKALAEAGNNFIACVAGDGGRYGLAVCDLSTGELHATAVEPAADRLVDELYVYKPAELIGEAALIDETARLLPPAVRPRRTEAVGEADPALVARQFGEGADGLHPAAAKAVAMLLSFLLATQKRTLSHIRRLNLYEPKRYLILDPFTRRNLELTETVRDRSKTGSLLWLLDRTVTAIGARMLRRWIEKPLMDASEINARLEAVECLAGQFIVRDELRDHLKRIYDLERLAGRIAYGTANARDLLALAASLAAVPAIAGLLAASGSKTLAALAEGLDDCGDIREWIDAAIDENAPATIREGGMIKAGYDERLDKFREAGSSGKRWMAELEAREREATGIKSLKLGYNKVFGYYIEVTKPNLHLVPEGRYERKQTLANAERFVTPELKEKEALILEAEERMVALEYELFCALRDRIAGEIGRLQHLADVLARVDALQSLADVSAARGYTKPVITDGYRLRISAGRHPVVEAVLEDGRFVANDTELSEERGSMLLITGPNMAGKSTYMRQVALIVIMAQIGCFVPARSAEIPIVDRIFTRIGAADDLIGGQSTFMVEMMDIRVMTEKATKNSLVIIDELGRGTSTNEGMAIAQAVIEYLHDRIGCKTLVSTHFHELARLEESLAGLRNGRMAVKEEGGTVTFLRKLTPGAADTSYGIYCAKIAGLPDSIVSRSYELLQLLEARAAERRKRASSVVQLSLFGDEPPAARSAAPAPEAGGTDPRLEEAGERLKKADLLNMTPLEAMQFLFELKQLLSQPAAKP